MAPPAVAGAPLPGTVRAFVALCFEAAPFLPCASVRPGCNRAPCLAAGPGGARKPCFAVAGGLPAIGDRDGAPDEIDAAPDDGATAPVFGIAAPVFGIAAPDDGAAAPDDGATARVAGGAGGACVPLATVVGLAAESLSAIAA